MTTISGSKMSTKVAIPAPRYRPMPPMISRAWRSPSRASRVSRCASAAGPNASCARWVARTPVDIALEMAAAGARALARDAVELDHGVPELGPAAVEPAAEDDAAAAARAERQHDHRLRAAAGARAVLGERGDVRVVLEVDRKPEPPRHQTGKVDACERDVHRADDLAALEPRRHAEADRARCRRRGGPAPPSRAQRSGPPASWSASRTRGGARPRRPRRRSRRGSSSRRRRRR